MQKPSFLQREFYLSVLRGERGERKKLQEKMNTSLNNQVLIKPILGGKQEVTAHLK